MVSELKNLVQSLWTHIQLCQPATPNSSTGKKLNEQNYKNDNAKLRYQQS